MSTAELASSYAALILADDGVEITVRSFLAPPGRDRNHKIEAPRHLGNWDVKIGGKLKLTMGNPVS